MSNYMNVLKRLEQDREIDREIDCGIGREPAVQATRPRDAGENVGRVRRKDGEATKSPPRIAAVKPGVSDLERTAGTLDESEGAGSLWDRIELLAHGKSSCRLVFAPVSTLETIDHLIAGLTAQARARRRSLLVADLREVQGHNALLARSLHGEPLPQLQVNLSGPDATSAVDRWLEQNAPGVDRVVFRAPPLIDSPDAALLARSCDGLVIVAQAELTARANLQAVAERSRAAGCNVLGIIMIGTHDPLPMWLERLIGPRTSGI